MSRKLPDWIHAYLEYTKLAESPDKFHLWTAVSAISGALRRRVYINQGYFEWVPNFYIIIVAPPGIVAKSTTSGIGMKILREIPSIKFGPNIVTWQALVQSFSQALEVIERKDGTMDTMSALTIHSAELGNLLDPKERQMVDLLVSLWDGDRSALEKVTKGMGSEKVQNPFINIIGCTTPQWISGAFPEYVIGGGLTSRCIFIYGKAKRHLTAYTGKALLAERNLGALRVDLIHDLEQISQMEGEYSLTSEAYAWGELWYREHNTVTIPKCTDYRLANYYARKQTHMHKLAMILAASESDRLTIGVDHLKQALHLLESVEVDMLETFSHIGLSPEVRAREEIIILVRNQGPRPLEEIARTVGRFLLGDEFKRVLDSACLTGQIELRNVNGKTYIAPKFSHDEPQPQPQGGVGGNGNFEVSKPAAS